ncbi:MAG TPA: rhodanese-like domain-containing protein [Puia sp.]|jgi:rhodanese-related sulfurtransferase
MQRISVQEVHERLAKGESLNLVDVREPAEHAEFNIGGFLIPLGKIRQMQVDELEDLKSRELICYCRSGNRSGQACQLLGMMGFSNTKNLEGGMLAWREKIRR